MSRSVEIGLMLLATSLAASAAPYPGIGRAATESEIRAWDIDVRPDFAGLPEGSGSVAAGETLWIAKCTSCHGDFGDANHVFPALIGNTTVADIDSGQVAALRDPGRTRSMIMKLATVSTLWDFIHRAMPWEQPKSLKADEVYALTAYLLNLADIVPSNFVLSQENIAEVQARLPNRAGMSQDHGLWKVDGKPDTRNAACMQNCVKEITITSTLPEFARSAHGELAKQHREYGAIRGTRTLPDKVVAATASPYQFPQEQLASNGCLNCHGIEAKIIGPGFTAIAEKHRERVDSIGYFKERIRKGGSGVWGEVAMPPMLEMSDTDLDTIVRWLSDGAPLHEPVP